MGTAAASCRKYLRTKVGNDFDAHAHEHTSSHTHTHTQAG